METIEVLGNEYEAKGKITNLVGDEDTIHFIRLFKKENDG